MDKKLIGLVAVFLLAFGLFVSILVFQQPITKLTKAKEEFLPSPTKSLIFAWPLSLSADGKSETIINVFVRNEKEFPITNKKVTLTTTLGTIKEIQPVSDKQGKTEFKLSSISSGVAQIKATVDNSIELEQKVSVKFDK